MSDYKCLTCGTTFDDPDTASAHADLFASADVVEADGGRSA